MPKTTIVIHRTKDSPQSMYNTMASELTRNIETLQNAMRLHRRLFEDEPTNGPELAAISKAMNLVQQAIRAL